MKNPEKYLRVLYAENDKDACDLVTTMLSFSNIEVTTAETIVEAFWLAQTEYFDLYLLDSRFPEGSGLDLCRSLRHYAPQTPILFYSGNAYETDKQAGLLAGASGYLTKPYFGDLAQTVLSAIEHNKKPVFVG